MSDAMTDVLPALLKERNAMLLSGDIERAKRFHQKWNPDEPLPPDEVMEISLHKARIAAVSLPQEVRELSRQWLADRGYSPLG